MARYLYNTSPWIMKENTNDTDSLFEKRFTKYPFNSEKKLMSDRFNKSFSFSTDSPLFQKAVEVSAFYISAGSSSYSDIILQGAINNFAILFWAWICLNNILHIESLCKPHGLVCKKITSICVFKLEFARFFYKQVLSANFPKD